VQPVVRVGGDAQIFRAALGDGLLQQVAPGVVAVRVAPVFGLVLENFRGAICSCILRRNETVQRVISKRLVAAVGCVFVIDDSEDIAIVRSAAGCSVSGMEVIADGVNGLAGRCGDMPLYLHTLERDS
jgi:hypothetical protein